MAECCLFVRHFLALEAAMALLKYYDVTEKFEAQRIHVIDYIRSSASIQEQVLSTSICRYMPRLSVGVLFSMLIKALPQQKGTYVCANHQSMSCSHVGPTPWLHFSSIRSSS